jgi:hypothetical protein
MGKGSVTRGSAGRGRVMCGADGSLSTVCASPTKARGEVSELNESEAKSANSPSRREDKGDLLVFLSSGRRVREQIQHMY